MFKFKSTLIALTITFFMLAGFVNSSDAFEITDGETMMSLGYRHLYP